MRSIKVFFTFVIPCHKPMHRIVSIPAPIHLQPEKSSLPSIHSVRFSKSTNEKKNRKNKCPIHTISPVNFHRNTSKLREGAITAYLSERQRSVKGFLPKKSQTC
ncbi:hypothetical protein VTL71DRAFT_16015 [Oculimacula yallundae]|uniref:Uncharacterized protein n=1 Tax=Oculimacula yallundae TaxID=86028 RepID=A0ABR4CE00_9HELO